MWDVRGRLSGFRGCFGDVSGMLVVDYLDLGDVSGMFGFWHMSRILSGMNPSG